MLTIPFQISETECTIFVVLAQDNIDRIKSYDPAELTIKKLGHPWNKMKIRDVVIMFSSEEERQKLESCHNREECVKLLRALSRGWKYCPEKGDHDAPYPDTKPERH